MFKPVVSPATWLRAALIAGAAAAAAPAMAQTVEELTVIGRQGVGPNVRSVSAVVSYRDLDLTTESGRAMLHQRVRLTAQDLCRQLGEGGMGGTAAAPSCEQDAINSVSEQQRLAVANAQPRALAAAPAPEPARAAPAAETYGQTASVTVSTTANAPIPDTPENRAAFGGPNSRGGQRTAPKGN